MNVRKSKVFARLFKKDTVEICRVSELLKGGHFSADDLTDKFVELSQKVWGEICEGKFVWTKEMVLSHFRICPEQIYCGFLNGDITATLTFMYENESVILLHTPWLEKTDDGLLTNHQPSGNTVFGVDLSVVSGSPANISSRIVLSAILINVIGDGLKGVYLGARIPSYHKHSQMNVREYVFGKRKSGKPLDPELYFYLKNGFEIVDIIPEYMEDPESLNYGVLIRWKNPFYWVTRVLPFLKPIIRFVGKKLFLRTPQTK
jgi:hypothetical protein